MQSSHIALPEDLRVLRSEKRLAAKEEEFFANSTTYSQLQRGQGGKHELRLPTDLIILCSAAMPGGKVNREHPAQLSILVYHLSL